MGDATVGERGGTSEAVGRCPWGLAAAGALLAALGGCDKLSESECLGLRSEAFDVINESHPCGDDTDCRATEWPLCPKPMSMQKYPRIAAVKAKFDKGECTEPDKKCRETPEVYCKQGLCVFRERPGGDNPVQAK